MTRRLERGRYFGRTVARRELRGLLLTVTAHAAGDRIPVHRHDRPYFCYVLEGGFAESTGRRTRHVGPAELVYHPRDEVHHDRFGATGGRCFNIELDGSWAAPEREQPEGPAILAADRGALAGRVYDEFARPDDLSPLAIQGLVMTLLAEAGRAVSPARRPPWLDRVVDLLHARYAEPLSLAVIAAEAGVHPVYLSRAFRRHLGLGPADYLRRLRVEIARRRLAETREPIARIAVAVGFADHAHFTRTFRRLIGTTPSRWRNERRG